MACRRPNCRSRLAARAASGFVIDLNARQYLGLCFHSGRRHPLPANVAATTLTPGPVENQRYAVAMSHIDRGQNRVDRYFQFAGASRLPTGSQIRRQQIIGHSTHGTGMTVMQFWPLSLNPITARRCSHPK